MHDPLYNFIDWTWNHIPVFKELHDDTKAIISLLAVNGFLILIAILVLTTVRQI